MADPMDRVSWEKKGIGAAYVPGSSGQAELVSLGIGHHDERILRISRIANECAAPALDRASELVARVLITGRDVEMNPVLH